MSMVRVFVPAATRFVAGAVFFRGAPAATAVGVVLVVADVVLASARTQLAIARIITLDRIVGAFAIVVTVSRSRLTSTGGVAVDGTGAGTRIVSADVATGACLAIVTRLVWGSRCDAGERCVAHGFATIVVGVTCDRVCAGGVALLIGAVGRVGGGVYFTGRIDTALARRRWAVAGIATSTVEGIAMSEVPIQLGALRGNRDGDVGITWTAGLVANLNPIGGRRRIGSNFSRS